MNAGFTDLPIYLSRKSEKECNYKLSCELPIFLEALLGKDQLQLAFKVLDHLTQRGIGVQLKGKLLSDWAVLPYPPPTDLHSSTTCRIE